MTVFALGHPLNTLTNGVTTFAGSRQASPTAAMRLAVSVRQGLATVSMTRFFRNDENVPVEAVLTFPVAFGAVLVGLKAIVGGRELRAVAKARETARESYEDALDRGKLAILHEEPLRGVHVVSIGNLAPGVEVKVIGEWMTPLACVGSIPSLRIPMTVGELYGKSPLLPADDLVTAEGALPVGVLTVVSDSGAALMDGLTLDDGPIDVSLDRSISLSFPGARFGTVQGVDAHGRQVSVSLTPAHAGDEAIRLAVLFDRSGSTSAPVGRDGDATVWAAMRQGLAQALKNLRPSDEVSLWQFDDQCERLGAGKGREAPALVDLLGEPGGGTELGAALRAVADDGDAPDVLILTDGQTWAADAHAAAALGRRITAVVVGAASFDAVVGHLAAMTGGQLFPAEGASVGVAIQSAMASMRERSSGLKGRQVDGLPAALTTQRSGVNLSITWEGAPTVAHCDSVGRFAAALALPLISEEDATNLAVSHGLCTHLTSLIIVDEEGQTVEGVSQQRKIPLREPRVVVFLRSGSSLAPMACHSELSFSLEAPIGAPSRPPVKIRWDQAANALIVGDLSSLEEELAEQIKAVAMDPAVTRLALQLGVDPVILTIALIARREGGRTAQRVARKILGHTPMTMLSEALAILSVHGLEPETASDASSN